MAMVSGDSLCWNRNSFFLSLDIFPGSDSQHMCGAQIAIRNILSQQSYAMSMTNKTIGLCNPTGSLWSIKSACFQTMSHPLKVSAIQRFILFFPRTWLLPLSCVIKRQYKESRMCACACKQCNELHIMCRPRDQHHACSSQVTNRQPKGLRDWQVYSAPLLLTPDGGIL